MASAALTVRVQEVDFDPTALQRQLLGEGFQAGAIATFTGYVRVDATAPELQSMELEHYPGMTEKSIFRVLEEAAQRWSLLAATVVHRVGSLQPGEQIVWVGVASAHRAAAFSACEFIMDYLKTRAPLWKKEVLAGGARWVDAREQDVARTARWVPET
jgi:molybdopterin synthase catalytic subunit